MVPNRPYWENMPPDPTQKPRNQEQFKYIEYQNPKEKQLGTLPSGVANSVMERNLLWLRVYHNRQLDTRNQSFPICKRNQTSDTKGYRIVPCFGWLKQIPVELSNSCLHQQFALNNIKQGQACSIIMCQTYSSIYIFNNI